MDTRVFLGALLAIFYLVALLIGVRLVFISVSILKANQNQSAVNVVIEPIKQTFSLTGLNSPAVILLAGLFLMLVPLYPLGGLFRELYRRDDASVKQALRELPPFRSQPQELTGVINVKTPRGVKQTLEYITFPAAFPSTPMVWLQANVGASAQTVTPTGFSLVLEKEDGFSGEEIQVVYVAREIPK